MESQEVEHYLQELSDELELRKIKKPVRLVVVGGVYMMLVTQTRASTKDVDIIPLDFPDTAQPNQATKIFRSAVNAVAKKYHMRRDWMNDVVASFVPDLGAVTLWRAYGNLQIYVPQAEYILALKLLAGREKDEDDIVALCERLCIETREQAQELVDRFANQQWQQECMLQQTLDAIF
jgi:hypothetical protein